MGPAALWVSWGWCPGVHGKPQADGSDDFPMGQAGQEAEVGLI